MTETDGGGAVVLVADDEEDLRTIMTIRLEQAGFEVETAGDGHEAYDRLTDDSPPVEGLLLDLNMPLMGGLELLERLADHRQRPYTVVFSGYDDSDGREAAFDLGADEFLVKPFSPADLATSLAERIG